MMKVIVRKQVQSRAAPMLQSVAISSLLVIISLIHRPAAVGAFRVSFSNRLYKSMQQHSNPQLNPPETLIRPIECRNANNHTEVGICMFSIDCMQNKGVPLSICKHNYFVGTCCKLPDYNNFVGIVYDLRETETAALLQGRRGGISINNNNNSNRDGAASGPKTTEQKLSSPSPQQQHQNSSANNSANLSASSETPAPSGSESSSPVGQQASSEQPLGASVLEKRSTVAAANSYDNYELVGSSLPTAAVSANLVLSKLHQLDEKYVISSTKLFQAASSATTTSLSPIETQPQTVRFPSETAASSGHQSGTNTSSGSETARNADGSSQQQQVGAASLGASNMVQHPGGHETHTTTTPLISFASSASNEEQASAAAGGNGKLAGATLSGGPYELVANKSSGDDLSPASPGQTGLDIIQGTLVSSAHSAPSMSRLSIQQQQQHQNSVYLLGDDSDPVSTQRLSAPPAVAPSSSASIVLSSNHQPNESKKQQHQASPASDQEFTISTTSQDSSSPVSSLIISSAPFSLAPNPSLSTSSWSSTPSSQSLAPIAEEFLTSSAIPANSSQSSESANMSAGLPASASASLSSVTLPPPPPAASIKQEANISSSSNNNNDNAPLSVTSSPYVDLVSSHSTQRQTTTPFTSSLSTAILPNISSHPYAPTTLAPAISSSQAYVSVPSSSHSSSSSLSSSSSAATSTAAVTSQQQVSTTSSGLPLGASQQQEPQQASASSASSVSPLFYSTSHSQQATASPTGPGSTSTTLGSHGALGLIHLGPRPGGGAGGLGGLHVASKIVTGSSTTNNLIPGLSGLQSAILSHIPFKLASGLSSGLSSYLQAAMKPNGANRPLISSNTATALQYQQHNSSNQHQSASQTTSSPTSSAAGSGNNLDAPKSTSGAAPLVHGAVRFPAGSTAPPGSSYSTSGSTGSQSTSGPAASQHQQQQEVAPGQGERDVLKKAQLVCGRPQVGHHHQAGELSKKRVARIVGGNQSAFGQWPWMVSLRQWRKGAFLHKCGAALLNENWAITAAHCVENVKAPDLLLRLGEFDVSNQNEPYPYIERRVKSVMSHPLFDPKTFEYDLALIRFTEPILYERNILPVCVPQGNDSYVDRMATVIGWGRLFEDGPLPDVIQHVDVPIITNQECEKMYKNAGFVEEIPEMFICAGISKGGRDSCEGDSGGPLTMVDHDGRSYLVGIISWGIGCALPSQPGVYTRITAFSPWINQIIST